MIRARSRLVIPFVAMALSCFAVFAGPREAPATVGEFALHISRVLGQQPVDQAAAVASLRKAGVDLGSDVSAVLTAGRAASMLRDLGVPAAVSSNPAETISVAKAVQIVTAFAIARGRTFSAEGHHHHGDCSVSPSNPEDDDCDGDHDGDHNGQGGDHDGQGGDHDGQGEDRDGHHGHDGHHG